MNTRDLRNTYRACKVVTIPAFEIEIDCCSIASWMDVLRMCISARMYVRIMRMQV